MDFRRMLNDYRERMWNGLEWVGGKPVCPECGTPRAVETKRGLLPCMCRCQRERYAEEEQERASLERSRKIEDNARKAFPEPGMRELVFAADDGRFGRKQMELCRKYALRCIEGVDYGLLMFGEPDGGKTFASCCIANELLDAGKKVVMRSVPQLVLSRGFDDEEKVRELLSCDLLVLDDLGTERSTSYAQEFVYAVVDGRYRQGKPMVVSTNLARAELHEAPDVTARRTYNRILEVCLPVQFDTGRRRSVKERYDAMRKDLGIYK